MIIVIDYDNDAILLQDNWNAEIASYRVHQKEYFNRQALFSQKMVQDILIEVFNRLDKDLTVMKQDEGQMHHVDSFSFDWL